jgi:hypothetical protein
VNLGLQLAQLVALLGTLGGMVALFKVGPDRRKLTAEAAKTGAEASKILTDAAVSMFGPAREQVGFLGAELAESRRENQQLRAEMGELRDEVKALRADLSAAQIELGVLRGTQR